ncbi:hypothetical protein X949_4625 [Burkholderia pseudomallei MSHR5609]|nr:hypothetical protein X949_4625 [Burkholderia pseudomallei MSHR5609]
MLVWNAIPSIVPMMSATFCELWSISAIVPTTSPTTVAPFVAMSVALSAQFCASRALSAFCFTVAVNCSMLAAVCCSAAACSSVRCDRSVLPAAIWRVAVAIDSEPSVTLRTVSDRLRCIVVRPLTSSAISSCDVQRSSPVRSPSDRRRRCPRMRTSGCVIAKCRPIAQPRHAARPNTISPPRTSRSQPYICSASSYAALPYAARASSSAFVAFVHATDSGGATVIIRRSASSCRPAFSASIIGLSASSASARRAAFA